MDITISLDFATLKKYWLSISAAGIGLWTSLNPAAQTQIIHYVASAVHKHPSLMVWSGLASLILTDLKQSPISQVKPPVQEAPPYVPPAKI